MGNILQNSLDVTYEDFLKGVFGARPKPERNALKSLFSEVVTGKSTLVSDLSKPLRANASKAECKRAQERVSGWLGNYDFVEATGCTSTCPSNPPSSSTRCSTCIRETSA